jgi:hypothetical protein
VEEELLLLLLFRHGSCDQHLESNESLMLLLVVVVVVLLLMDTATTARSSLAIIVSSSGSRSEEVVVEHRAHSSARAFVVMVFPIEADGSLRKSDETPFCRFEFLKMLMVVRKKPSLLRARGAPYTYTVHVLTISAVESKNRVPKNSGTYTCIQSAARTTTMSDA